MTNRMIAFLIATGGLFAALAAVYLRGPSSPPPGQPALLTLVAAGPGGFDAAFDASPEQPRLLLLFSPT